jgi:2-methylisocitrate lyase-like PEP mutase family enzyme
VKRIAATGASGLSIEDFDPATGILPVGVAVERVAAASDAAKTGGMTLTARAENHLYEAGDLEDTITRLAAYRDAGADVLYAPGLTDRRDIERLTGELASPVNVLARPDGPTVAELADSPPTGHSWRPPGNCSPPGRRATAQVRCPSTIGARPSTDETGPWVS